MSKILGLILGFISSILLVAIGLLITFKITIYNKNYVLSKIEETKYYEKIYDEIGKEMKHNILSSGVDQTVINGLYNKSDVKNDIKNIVGAIYSNSKFTVDTSNIKTILIKNIDKYLEKNNIILTDKTALDSYVSNIIDTYEKEVSIYGYLQNYTSKFVKIGNYIELAIGICIILFLIILLINKYIIKYNYLGISLLSSSLMITYFKYFIFGKIDTKNILIISDAFSSVLRKILVDINNYIIYNACIYFILGIILIIINSYKKNKKLRSS